MRKIIPIISGMYVLRAAKFLKMQAMISRTSAMTLTTKNPRFTAIYCDTEQFIAINKKHPLIFTTEVLLITLFFRHSKTAESVVNNFFVRRSRELAYNRHDYK